MTFPNEKGIASKCNNLSYFKCNSLSYFSHISSKNWITKEHLVCVIREVNWFHTTHSSMIKTVKVTPPSHTEPASVQVYILLPGPLVIQVQLSLLLIYCIKLCYLQVTIFRAVDKKASSLWKLSMFPKSKHWVLKYRNNRKLWTGPKS